MSRNRRIALTLCSLAGLSTFWTGCSAAKQTELVAGVSTQVRVPRDIRTVRVDVTRNGAPFLCRAYRVYDGKVLLPRTLGTIPAGSTSDAITISITGFTAAESEPGFNAFTDECLVSPGVSKDRGEGGGARVLRRARLPYDPDVIRFVPMPLRYSCFDKECDPNNTGEKTCKAGQCVDAGLDVTTLKKFTPGLADGTDSSCFSPKVCFPEPGVPAQVVDPDTCTFAVPGSPPSSLDVPAGGVVVPNTGNGVNVRVTYDGGWTNEILDLDKEEGFFIPDPNFPQRFQLAPGLCDLINQPSEGGHRITGVSAFGFCQPKLPNQPICAAEANKIMTGSEDGVSASLESSANCKAAELWPTPSELVVVAENSTALGDFYKSLPGSPTGTTAGKNILNAFNDPSLTINGSKLKVQVWAGDKSTPSESCAATTTSLSTLFNFEGATKSADEYLMELVNLNPIISPATQNMLYGKLLAGSASLSPAGVRRGLILLGSHGFKDECTPANSLKTLSDTAYAAGLTFYGIALGAAPAVADSVANDLGVAFDRPTDSQIKLPSTVDARGAQEASAGQVLLRAALDLTTCSYENSTALAADSTAKLTFSSKYGYTSFDGKSVQGPAAVEISRDSSCTVAGPSTTTAGGWNFNSEGKIIVCGGACDAIRQSRAIVALDATAYTHISPAMPIYAPQDCSVTIP